MENDMGEFYESYCGRIHYIAHKSCIYVDGKYFSNNKFIFKDYHSFQYLKDKCNLIDEIENNTYINVQNSIRFSPQSIQILFCFVVGGKKEKWFEIFEDFYNYIHINYPHLIKNNDIKIAIK